MRALDSIDRNIIDQLRRDAWPTYVDLGARIGWSPSATQRRVERLKKERVIALVADEVADRRLSVFLLLELVRDGARALARLKSELESFEGFDEAQVVVGTTDVLVSLRCRSMEAFNAWSMETLGGNENVRHCSTLVGLKKL